MKRAVLLASLSLLLLVVGFGLGNFAARQGFLIPAPRTDSAKEPEESRAAPPSVAKVVILPFTVKDRFDAAQLLRKEIENINANFPRLVEDKTSLKLLPLTEEARKNHGDNSIAAGRALGADAVLTGLIYIDAFVNTAEYVQVNLLDVRTGKSLWSKPLLLRERDAKDRIQVLPRLQQAPGEIVEEFSKRWPKK